MLDDILPEPRGPWKSQRYLEFVRSLPSVITGTPGCEAHHLIGHGHSGMATKVSDLWTFPLTREQHRELHRIGFEEWEAMHGLQWRYVAITIEKAVKNNVLRM